MKFFSEKKGLFYMKIKKIIFMALYISLLLGKLLLASARPANSVC